MRTRPLGFCTAAAIALPATLGQAADLPYRAAAPPLPALATGSEWTGFYIGSQIGGFVSGRNSRTVSSGDGGPTAVNGFGGVGGRTGLAVGRIEGPTVYKGFHVGYNYQLGSVVLGLEGELDGLGRIDDELGSARARLGYAFGRTLLYGTAGIAVQSVSGGAVGAFVGGNGGSGGNGAAALGVAGFGGSGGNGFGTLLVTRPGTTRVGFVGGLGTEFKLTPQVGAGLEALYYAFDKDPGIGAGPRNALTINGRLTFHSSVNDGLTSPEFASWAGLYGGGHIGAAYDQNKSVIENVVLANGQNGTAGTRGVDGGGGGGGAVAFASLQRTASFLGGVHGGYNIQTGRLVFGGEGDIDFGVDASHTYLASARARIGYAFSSYLLYGTAGAAFNSNEAVRSIFAGNGGNGGNGVAGVIAAPGGAGGLGGQALALRANDTRVGFVIGGGVEAKLAPRVTAGAETLYYAFDKGNGDLLNPAPGRAFLGKAGDDTLVLRTRLSISLQP